MRVFITIDVDPHPEIDLERSIKSCIKIFKDFNILDKITWFINTKETELTKEPKK